LLLAWGSGTAVAQKPTSTLKISDAPRPVPIAAAQKAPDPLPDAEKVVEPKNEEPKSEESAPPREKAQPKRVLAPPMVALRDRVRRTMVALGQQPFNTRDNTCVEILDFCQAFGCKTMVSDGGQAGQKVNGITCLCWNMPCAEFQPLMVCDGRLAPRVGYGYQDAPSRMAAVLAMARVPLSYPARAGETVRTVADLIEYEKLTCRTGTDMSLKLIALSNYVQEPTWKNSEGEEWSLQRIVREELDRPVGTSPHGGTTRLLGLAHAVQRATSGNKPLEGDFLRAKQYVDESTEYALRSQNSDGSWGRIANRDYPTALSSTGHMIEWLVMSMPDDRLEDPAIVRSVDFVESLLSSQHYRGYVHSLSSREIAAVMHSAHALVVYDQRVFVPADPPPASALEETTPRDKKTAARQVSATVEQE
jgi:hypothetical protein